MATTLHDANGSVYLATLWGSDCLGCGNANPGSQVCSDDAGVVEEAGEHETVALWTLAAAPRPVDALVGTNIALGGRS
jgi:hypothetical protein